MKKKILIALTLTLVPVISNASETYTLVGERVTTENTGTVIKTTPVNVPNLPTLAECETAITQLKSLTYTASPSSNLTAKTNMTATCVKLSDPGQAQQLPIAEQSK